MRQLTFTAPDQLQGRIKGLRTPQFIAAARGLRPTTVLPKRYGGDEGGTVFVGPPHQ